MANTARYRDSEQMSCDPASLLVGHTGSSTANNRKPKVREQEVTGKQERWMVQTQLASGAEGAGQLWGDWQWHQRHLQGEVTNPWLQNNSWKSHGKSTHLPTIPHERTQPNTMLQWVKPTRTQQPLWHGVHTWLLLHSCVGTTPDSCTSNHLPA